jgi:hypothetical protein
MGIGIRVRLFVAVLQLVVLAPAQAAATVLVEVRLSIDGKPIAPLGRGDANQRPRFFLANLDALEAPRRIQPTPIAAAPAGRAWLGLDLSPGSYFLQVLPPGVEQNPPAVAYSVLQGRYGRLLDYRMKPGRGGYFSQELGAFAFAGAVPADFQPLTGFWLEVPRDGAIIHVGSLSMACKAGRGLFGSLIDSCSDFLLGDDAPTAQQVAAAVYPGRSFMTRLLLPYGSLRAATASSPAGDEPAPAPLASPGLGVAPVPLGLAAPAALHGAGPAINFYNLLVVGGQISRRAADQRRTRELERELQGCLASLSGDASRLDVGALFASALAAQADGGSRRWSVSLPLLRLREVGEEGLLGLELGLALVAQGGAAGVAEGHLIVVSGPDVPPASAPHGPVSPLYLLQVAERAAPRTRAEWCGEAGAATLDAEVGAALRRIAAFAVSLRSASPAP